MPHFPGHHSQTPDLISAVPERLPGLLEGLGGGTLNISPDPSAFGSKCGYWHCPTALDYAASPEDSFYVLNDRLGRQDSALKSGLGSKPVSATSCERGRKEDLSPLPTGPYLQAAFIETRVLKGRTDQKRLRSYQRTSSRESALGPSSDPCEQCYLDHVTSLLLASAFSSINVNSSMGSGLTLENSGALQNVS